MPGKTSAQKAAQEKYMSNFAVARVRIAYDDYDLVKAHAATQGESVNAFINRAIFEQMKRDREQGGIPTDD